MFEELVNDFVGFLMIFTAVGVASVCVGTFAFMLILRKQSNS